MDEDISRWVIEFLLRQSIDQALLNKIMAKLPIAKDNARLKKTVLLRAIQAEISGGSVSETILESTEAIEELDQREGIKVLDSMKAAYCAVAVECTVKYLGGSADKRGKYFDALKKIWREKIKGLEKSGKSELVTDELRKWRDEIEAALWDENTCKMLLSKNTRNEALRLVRVYLAEAWAIMGPTFLELAAGLMVRGDDKMRDGIGETAVSSHGVGHQPGSDGHEFAEGMVNLVRDQVRLMHRGNGGERSGHNGAEEAASFSTASRDFGVSDRPTVSNKETQKENVLSKRKHVTCHRRQRGPAKISNSEELDGGTVSTKYNSLSSPMVSKLQEALKSSSLELRAAVTDPLPDALRLADSLVADMARNNVNTGSLVADQNRKGAEASMPSSNGNVDHVQAEEANHGNRISINRKDVCQPSLMERNSTAHTYEWDDSIDGSPDRTPDHRNRFHLPSPKKRPVSPLKKHEINKFGRRRKMKRWSLEEEDALRQGVQMYGKGNWKLILKSNPDAFAERTEVDLKDKWRNMTRY